jgi:hypothetical protein
VALATTDLLELGRLLASLPAPILLGGAAVLFYRNWQSSEEKFDKLQEQRIQEQKELISALSGKEH